MMTWACQKPFRCASEQEGFLPFPFGCAQSQPCPLKDYCPCTLQEQGAAVVDPDHHAQLIIQTM